MARGQSARPSRALWRLARAAASSLPRPRRGHDLLATGRRTASTGARKGPSQAPRGAVPYPGIHSGTRPIGVERVPRCGDGGGGGSRTPVPGQTSDDGRLDAGGSCVGLAEGRDGVGSAQWSAPQAGGAADGESCDSGSSQALLERRKEGAGAGNGTSPIRGASGADSAGGRLRSGAAAHPDQDLQRLLVAWPMIPESARVSLADLACAYQPTARARSASLRSSSTKGSSECRRAEASLIAAPATKP